MSHACHCDILDPKNPFVERADVTDAVGSIRLAADNIFKAHWIDTIASVTRKLISVS